MIDGQGERAITNIRRLAGSDRRPGDVLIAVATILLALLAAGLLAVSFAAQFVWLAHVRHERIPATPARLPSASWTVAVGTSSPAANRSRPVSRWRG